MNLSRYFFLASLLLISSAFADTKTDADLSQITGQFSVGGATLVDQAPEEPQDTHFRIYLTGKAAEALYSNMKVEAAQDVCLDDGTLSKNIGEMQCLKSLGNEYECSFAIDIEKQVIGAGAAC